MSQWHIITCEYPPQPGGVSDYTKLVANGLAEAGDEVHVWCPAQGQEADVGGQRPEVRGQGSEVRDQKSDAGLGKETTLVVHRDFGRFSREDLNRVAKELDQFPAPRRLLVQWVPHGYGYRSMNLPFCFWLRRRARRQGDHVELMVHEPFLPFREGSRKQDAAATVHRLMIVTLLQAASHVWVSIPDWEKRLRPFARENKSFGWLPVPSNIPVIDDPDSSAQIRERFTVPGGPLIGHFGAYDRYMTEFMLQLLPLLLNETNNLSVLLLGKGSLELRDHLIETHPKISERLHAKGMLAAEDLSRHISACDVMLQPYQDGVSGRRTSVMSALAHGVPVITTEGKATESCWAESKALALTRVDDVQGMLDTVHRLSTDGSKRRYLGSAGRSFYEDCFADEHTIATLRKSVPDNTPVAQAASS